ncbi:MAG: hypothetical protein WCS44_08420 [Bacillota bacterium]
MGRANKIVCLFLLTMFLLLPAQASDNIVINHVITDKIIQAQDDSVYIGQVLLGFTVGRAKFYTLTQVALDQGLHQGRVALVDSAGKTISEMDFPNMYAEHNNTLFSMAVMWDVSFKKAGDYFVVIHLNQVKVAQ